MIVTISVSFADSIRVMVKYGEEIRPDAHVTLDAKIDRHLHECRGQRNFYITGFALFLILWVLLPHTSHMVPPGFYACRAV